MAEMKKFAEMYRNPLINSAITFLEPLPVGLVIALVSAGILRRRRRRSTCSRRRSVTGSGSDAQAQLAQLAGSTRERISRDSVH